MIPPPVRSLLVCLSVCSSGFGCASIIDGTSQVVSFNSNPNTARVVVNGAEIGTTPLSTQIKRSNSTVVMFRKDGYADQTVTLQTKLNPWFWGNIIFGGFFGSTTDGVSGAVREYAPNSYYVTMQPTVEPNRMASSLPNSRTGAVRDFVLVNFDSLRAEALAGRPGEYTRALNRLLVEAERDVLSTTELQATLESCKGPVRCAELLATGRTDDGARDSGP